ncbi:hypothetical protein ACJMK2_025221 [Sinanodonta woodiana]|uniref:Sushi domain-containing protein n=1 Tax=Sinanodonta woodiana TaxID=1069815 RepID=A0ABD3XI84_SINWO
MVQTAASLDAQHYEVMGYLKCPDIAEPQEILIPENLDYLTVDNYNVTTGSVVNIGCLSKDSHTLTGAKTLTCLDTGHWDNPLPKCLPKSLNDNWKKYNAYNEYHVNLIKVLNYSPKEVSWNPVFCSKESSASNL